MTDKALAGGNVAIGLDIHCARRLKSSLCNSLFKLFKYLGIVFFNRFIGISLRVSISEFGVFIHEPKLNQNRSEIFLNGMNSAPIISDVKMRISNKRNASAAFIVFIGKYVFVNIISRRSDAVGFKAVKINQVKSAVKLTDNKSGKILVEHSALSGVKEQFNIINKRLNRLIHNGNITALENLPASSDAQALGVSLVIGL